MTLTDRETNPVELILNDTFYILDLVLCCRYLMQGMFPGWSLWGYKRIPQEFYVFCAVRGDGCGLP
jgi:hypothetical protein